MASTESTGLNSQHEGTESLEHTEDTSVEQKRHPEDLADQKENTHDAELELHNEVETTTVSVYSEGKGNLRDQGEQKSAPEDNMGKTNFSQREGQFPEDSTGANTVLPGDGTAISTSHDLPVQTETSVKISSEDPCANSAYGQHQNDYLQHVITRLQAVAESQTGMQKDDVVISRGELTLLVHHTLKKQTMWNYLQQLIQENNALKQEKQLLVELVMQIKQSHQASNVTAEDSKLASTQGQFTEGQVFRFDKCSLQDCSSPSQQQGQQESNSSMVQMDGESVSLQLPSQLGYDGDPPCSSQTGARERGASGNIPHVLDALHGTPEAAAFPPATNMLNIPREDVFQVTRIYSLGPQFQEGASMASGYVSKEQFELALEELEKTKRHVAKLLKDGGISPDTSDELVHLRTNVSKLRAENISLSQDLDRMKAEHDHRTLHFQRKLQKQEELLKKKDEVMGILSAEVKQLKSGAPTQPASRDGCARSSSSLGQTAQPTISEVTAHQIPVSTHSLSLGTQTEGPYDVMHSKVLEEQLQQLTLDKANLERQLIHARDNEQEHGMALEKVRAKKRDLENQLRGTEEHGRQLAAEITGLSDEIEELQKKAKESEHKRCALEGMIQDERRRYSRDENELLKRIDYLTKEKQEASRSKETLARLLVAVDLAWRGGQQYGCAVPSDYTAQLTSLQRQLSSGHHHTSSRPTVPRPPSHTTNDPHAKGLMDPRHQDSAKAFHGTSNAGSSPIHDHPSWTQPSGGHHRSLQHPPLSQSSSSPYVQHSALHEMSPQSQPNRSMQHGRGSGSSLSTSSRERVPRQHPH